MQFPEVMKLCVKDFAIIFQSMFKFARDNEQYTSIQRLAFVLNRGFREFDGLYTLKPDCIIDFKHNLPDYLNGVC